MVKPVASSFRYRWVILGVCWLAFIVAFMQRLSIGPLAPFLKEDLDLTSAQVGLFMSAAAFGYGLTTVPAGLLADRIGIRWLLLIGEVFGGIFIASMFTVTSFSKGLMFMALAGMGMGCLSPSTTKAVLMWFPVRERATAMGFKQTAVNVGGIITATTLPTVALTLGWHYGFLGIGFIAVVIGIVSFILYKQPPKRVSLNASDPVISAGSRLSGWEVLRGRDVWLVMFTGMCLSIIEFSAIAYFVLYLKSMMLFAVVAAGFFLAIMEAGGAFGKPITGLISDRLFHGGRRNVYLLMCCVAFAACIIFSFLGQGSSWWIIILLSLILGFAGVGWGGLHLTLVGEFAGRELAGVVTGLASVITLVGNILGPPIFGYIIDTTGSYRIGWQFLAVTAILGAILLLFVREERRRI